MGESLQLHFPGVSYVGPGTVEHLGEEAIKLGRRALLVTGRQALHEAGITDRLTSLLEAAGIRVWLFDQVPPEPTVDDVDAVRACLQEKDCEVVVEAGGGSAIDAGKVAATLVFEEAPTVEFHGNRPIARPGLPHIAIATTSGTGAEVTRNGVIIDPASGVKKSIRDGGVMPTVSITDADLTASCPPEVTAATGMDALVQAIESYFSVHAISVTEALSLRAVALIVQSLPSAFEDGRNMAARAAMSEGSYMAGLALGSARLGAVHGLAHPLGVFYDLPHGVVCAALMPPVLQGNVQAAPDKYESLRRAMGADPLQMLENMLDELDLPHTLGPYPDREWERRIVDYAVASGSARANPRPVDEEYVLRILRDVSA